MVSVECGGIGYTDRGSVRRITVSHQGRYERPTSRRHGALDGGNRVNQVGNNEPSNNMSLDKTSIKREQPLLES
jgi:hypothetical protein